MTTQYKYRTKVETPGEVLIMRIPTGCKWPKDSSATETLIIEGTDRRAALKEAYNVEACSWG